MLRTGTQPVPVTLNGQWQPVELALVLDLSSTATRTGTLRVTQVNEGSLPVYFDSLTLTHPQDRALVSQEQHYYPFGLPLAGVAVNTVPAPEASRDQYNGGSELQDALLGAEQGIYSTFYRAYDPATGRFQGLDPLADKYAGESPYSFGFNDPVNFNDPNGDDPILMNGRLMNPHDVVTGAETWTGSSLDWQALQMGGAGIPQVPGVNGNYVTTTQIHEAQQRIGYDGNGNAVTRGTGEIWTTQSKKWELRFDSNYIKEDAAYYGSNVRERLANGEFWLDVVLDQLDYKGDPRVCRAVVPDIGIVGPASGLKVAKGAYSVYKGVRNGEVVYWGLTKNISSRIAQHTAGGRSFVVEEVFSGLSRSAARGLEQLKIDQYGLKRLDNLINGIGTKNQRMAEYYREAVRYLRDL